MRYASSFTLCTLCTLLSVAMFAARPASAQFTVGAGGGIGMGSRGGSAKGAHGLGFVEFKLPVLPGLRADGIVMDAPAGAGKFSLALSTVWSLPLPVVKPYVVGGWGSYGVGGDFSRSGWNVGIGVRVKLSVGVFAEVRRHQRIARDLVTVGVAF